MVFPLVIEYATEGGPLLVTDLKSLTLWRGAEDDGTGAEVEYMGDGIDRLDPPYRAKKPGRQSRKFATLGEAREFEQGVLAAFRKLHPKAAPPPDYPEMTAYYIGDERVFSTDLTFTSAVDRVVDALESDVQLVPLQPRGKVKGLFVQQNGGGRGVLAVAPEKGLLVLAKMEVAAPADAVAKALASRKPPAAKLKLDLDGHVFVVDATLSATQLAMVNWGREDFVEAARAAFAKSASGPVRIPDQQLPCAGFVRVEPGSYGIAYKAGVDVGPTGADVVWITRS